MRLFIGVMMSDPMKKALIDVLHELKGQGINASFVPAANFHMTMAFIGETNQLEEVKAVMSSLPVEKARLSFSDFGFFDDTFWIGIKGNQKIKKYAADLRKALKDAGLPCDMAKFEPHVTLLRKVKGRRPSGLKVPDRDMTISKISLFRSDMKDGKRVYKEIFSVS